MSDQRLTQSPEKTKQQSACRASRPPSAPSYHGGLHPILQLQRTIGNRRVAQLIQAKRLTPQGKILSLQRKLTVGTANDPYEQEADRVASQVVSMSDAVVQRTCATCVAGAPPCPKCKTEKQELLQRQIEPEEEEKELVQAKPLDGQITPLVQGQVGKDDEEDERIQAASVGAQTDSFEAGTDVETRLSLSKGHGSPLPDSVRAYMEPRFGLDFSHVRVHTGSNAIQMNREVGAQAFTHGSDIYFGANRSPTNLDLTAHELTHVVQQMGGAAVQRQEPKEAGRDRESDLNSSTVQQRQGRSRLSEGQVDYDVLCSPVSQVNGRWLQRQVPKDITAQAGPVSGQGGLIYDSSRKRMSIIIGQNDTLRTVAKRLLPIWNNALPFVPQGAATPRPVTQLTEEQLAQGLLVYNRYYLAVPLMIEWKVGLRFPLPIDVNQVTGKRTINPDLIATWANTFDPAWVPLLSTTPAATVAPTQAALQQSVQTFLKETQTLAARGIYLSTRAMRNAREAEPFVHEVFRQAASETFDLALAFMDQIVIHQFDLLASQTAGQGIIDTIRNALANAPSSPSSSQQQSLARANQLLNRLGVFSTATAERFRDIYATEVSVVCRNRPRCCMVAAYHGVEGLFSEGVSQSIQDQVARESREVMRRTSRNTDHMDRIMETVRARGMAGPETELVYQAASNMWQPDPEATVLGMTHPSVSGWYFFGLSLHGAYHSVILAVDKTDPADPRIYWMDQSSHGFTNDVTGTLMDNMRRFSPGYGLSPSRLWQIMPAADSLIILA